MLRKPLLSLLLALLLGGGFVYGLTRLFVLRYEIGDIYPPYSSLRADPLGTKALAAALDELPGVEVRRNFKPLPKLRPSGPVTLIYTGVPHRAYWTEQEVLAFDSLVAGGSRAVFTFFPVEKTPTEREEAESAKEERAKKKKKIQSEQPETKKKKSKDKKDGEKKTDGKKTDEEETDKEGNFIEFGKAAKRWGFNFGFLPEDKAGAYKRHAALVEPGGQIESDISWHSALYFRDLKPHWKVLYMCGTMPVIIERRYGDGSIVLVADSYLVSNEALRKERHPRLLARLFSGPSTVIFDEESHGLRDDPGIVSLARKYRLHGVAAGLVLLAVFFVWKNAVRFIPTYEPQFAESDVIAGKESGEGFINLLRRAIRPSAVFDACVAEWRKAFVHQPRELAKVEEIVALEQARPARERDPIAAYRTISRALARKF
jgi:hypothetical protein